MEKVTVVKVGGAIVENSEQLAQLLKDFAAIPGKKVLVHGGGRRATKVAAALGIESKMVNGRRITDADMLEVVTMVYGGLVNKNLVAKLQANGVNALGLTGADMDVIHSHKRPLKDGIDFGFVGDVERANGKMLQTLLEEDITPVMAPLTAQQVYDRMYVALDTIANQECQIQDERSKSGVVLVNKKEHSIVAQYHEWMTFKKNFVVLDRTRFNYTVIAKCTDGHLHLTLERMTFLYEQGRPTEMRTSAEEWISDKEAINKKGTKLLPGSAKFRRSTIDRKDELFELITKMVKGNE